MYMNTVLNMRSGMVLVEMIMEHPGDSESNTDEPEDENRNAYECRDRIIALLNLVREHTDVCICTGTEIVVVVKKTCFTRLHKMKFPEIEVLIHLG